MGPISDFISSITVTHNSGKATEHSYRSAFEALFAQLDSTIDIINEPKRVAYGAPDIAIQRDDIVIGYLEAKDIGIDLRRLHGSNKEQQQRYLQGCPNLIYSNGLDWDFFRNGDMIASVSIGQALAEIHPYPEQYDILLHQLQDYISQRPQTITSPKELAQRMAGKAVLIKDVLHNALLDDEHGDSELMAQYNAFREHLIHDISIPEFADIYAETIAYGMFAARLHDQTLSDFSRQEALELLPKSNPFLRSLFGYVAGHDLDDRIAWIINDLAKLFQATNVAEIMQGFGKLTGQQDPFLHFYETFLAAYNPRKRKARGVWYTPEPVVNFIVRAVDQVLQTEFGLVDGLADTSKINIDWDVGQKDRKGKPQMTTKQVHRVQILDPATGTGTFLAEVIKQIAPKIKGVAPGMWSHYIEQDLIPRLHGFEILMASYAMCHMKLDMILTDLGYKPSNTAPPRLSVYLTNSLEQGEVTEQTLFAQWLSREAKGANSIKHDMPIMCVIGNPPYSGVSSNNGEWAKELIEPYKKEPGGKVKLKERNPKWINDDYVKFIRFAEHMISKTGEGVLGFITNHGYLDSPTFRGMRWHLMQSFDILYLLDLHGNSKKKEVAPDGSNDTNVFDIMQGVAIIIAVKRRKEIETTKKKPIVPAEVFHIDFWGSRQQKYDRLQQSELNSVLWTKLDPDPKYLMFYPINRKLLEAYDAGFELARFMPMNQIGFQSHRDGFAVAFEKAVIENRLNDMLDDRLTDDDLRKRYDLSDNRDWQVKAARNRIMADNMLNERIVPCEYRPFDRRFCMLDETMMDYPRWSLLKNTMPADNFGLNFVRQTKASSWQHGLVSKYPAPAVFVEIKDGSNFAPLYILDEIDQSRRVNYDPKLYAKLQAMATHPEHGKPDEVEVFDYIYGVLHCPAYRETYAEFLKIDFPRIPWPASPGEFRDISAKGRQLRQLHLMQPDAIGETPYPFTNEGDTVILKQRYFDGKVWINQQQYFDQVPELAWGFYIGGYQPAQKWLKDRKGRKLSFDDVKHYQKIIKILAETNRIMQTINMTLPE